MSVVYFHAGNPATLTLICAVVFVLSLTAFAFPSTLVLERAFPVNHRIELSQLRNRDSVRHRRILQQHSSSSSSGAVDFPVKGNYDPSVVGLYYTKVQLGSPPKEYYVQIDTGSDVLWVACTPCDGCPTSSGLQIPMEFYDPSSSSTSSAISCSDRRCYQAAQLSDSGCSNNRCGYQFHYGDGSGNSGYYVSDVMHLDMVGVGSTSANVVFGCTMSQTGLLIKPDRAVNGIFGFGQSRLSVISQLSAQGTTPNAFSHCLIGGDNGGGILVIGQIMEPRMVYTPIIQSQPHYNVNLESISVNGQTLPLDPSLFALSDDDHGGTIIDSGTTLAYLAKDALKPFVDAISQSVSQSAQPLINKEEKCYVITSSVSDLFPPVSFHFAGGASMHLKPQDYLIRRSSMSAAEVWCIGFGSMPNQQITILGDLVLKDKIIVYDLGGQRIGWSDYDCSSSVNVSVTSSGGRSEVVNAGQVGGTTSLQITRYELIIRTFILASIIQLAVTYS
ncbi:aspartic proteinase 36-like [Bidens hawaiensis]|uniref:aspartic proteinase 36-like n=1 Tax=Bidens hawaiensis TaxID=980011 RepID=UPI00404B31CD